MTYSVPNGFFTASVNDTDAALAASLNDEAHRQQTQIELIASENIVSRRFWMPRAACIQTNMPRATLAAVTMAVVSTSMSPKSWPSIARSNCSAQPMRTSSPTVARRRTKPLCWHHEARRKIPGHELGPRGHLSHGAKVNLSGKWFEPIHYGVREQDGLIDYNQVEDLAKEHKPSMLIAGGSAYPRVIDFKQCARLRTRLALACGSTWRTSQVSLPVVRIQTHWIMQTLLPQQPTRPCAVHVVVSLSAVMRIWAKTELSCFPRPAGWPIDARDRGQGCGLR